MSIIPKVSVGLPKKREKRNLNFDCSTTSNIGNVQPTMCREMVPNEKYSVKVSSLVRLASMPLPTFGRMSLRHHHVFVPVEDIYEAWNALLSGQHYKPGHGNNTYVPTKCPYFHMNSVPMIQHILEWSDISICPKGRLNKPYTITATNVDWEGNVYEYGAGEEYDYHTYAEAQAAAIAADLARVQTAWSAIRIYGASNQRGAFGKNAQIKLYVDGRGSLKEDDYGTLNFGNFYASVRSSDTTLAVATEDYPDGNVIYNIGGTVIQHEGADLITDVGDYTLLIKFKPLLKRLRTIFIGLGYQFSPYNPEEFNPFKLVAYYKAWFSLFRPNREKTWVDTNAYELVKSYDRASGLDIDSNFVSLWSAFILDLQKDCFYYLPMDYYSMAQIRPQQSMSDAGGASNPSFQLDSGVSINSLANGGQHDPTMINQDSVMVRGVNQAAGEPVVSLKADHGAVSPLTLRLAQRLLTYANKNTVIGRSIRDYLKAHYGVSDPNCDANLEGVVRIGSSRININISDVMSTAENQEGFLGEYAGKGIGYGDSDTFSFTAEKFGYWITLTTVVPESGYYQGYLRENRHLTKYEFFLPEFDAIGYQTLERGEIMDDYNCDSADWNPASGFARSKAFGFVPRYSEYKVGRNIVNGDLSLVGLKNSMAPYTLDRRISAGIPATTGYSADGSYTKVEILRPRFIPEFVYDDFRKIDPTDHLGQYNRIFNYTLNDLDHFIIHNVFDVRAIGPMKSLSRSFDTYGEEDDASIDVIKS